MIFLVFNGFDKFLVEIRQSIFFSSFFTLMEINEQ